MKHIPPLLQNTLSVSSKLLKTQINYIAHPHKFPQEAIEVQVNILRKIGHTLGMNALSRESKEYMHMVASHEAGHALFAYLDNIDIQNMTVYPTLGISSSLQGFTKKEGTSKWAGHITTQKDIEKDNPSYTEAPLIPFFYLAGLASELCKEDNPLHIYPRVQHALSDPKEKWSDIWHPYRVLKQHYEETHHTTLTHKQASQLVYNALHQTAALLQDPEIAHLHHLLTTALIEDNTIAAKDLNAKIHLYFERHGVTTNTLRRIKEKLQNATAQPLTLDPVPLVVAPKHGDKKK